MPRLANPSIAVDKTIDVPGTFWAWSGEGADANKAKTFACSVVEFSGIHQWDGPQSPSAAFHLAIQDTDGIATAETCWMAYPKPFLDYYLSLWDIPGGKPSATTSTSTTTSRLTLHGLGGSD